MSHCITHTQLPSFRLRAYVLEYCEQQRASLPSAPLQNVVKLNTAAKKMREEDEVIHALQDENLMLKDTVKELTSGCLENPTKQDGKTYPQHA